MGVSAEVRVKWIFYLQWGFKSWPFKKRTHLKTGLFEGRNSNGFQMPFTNRPTFHHFWISDLHCITAPGWWLQKLRIAQNMKQTSPDLNKWAKLLKSKVKFEWKNYKWKNLAMLFFSLNNRVEKQRSQSEQFLKQNKFYFCNHFY